MEINTLEHWFKIIPRNCLRYSYREKKKLNRERETIRSETGCEIDRYNAPNARWKQEGPLLSSGLASRHHPQIESRLNGDARQWRR